MKLTTLKSSLPTIAPRLAQPSVPDRLRGRAAVTRRQRIMVRDLCTCAGCGRITEALEVDHIVPLWQGGADVDANLQCLCSACHAVKTAREAGMRSSMTA